MRRTRLQVWKLATIRGVDLKIHISLLFLLIYIMFIASAQFPFVLERSGIEPSTLSGTPYQWGAIFAIGLFLSIVIHEFAHVIVAQSMGVRVEGITLMMLGGVSEMERIPEKPYAEFKISIAGPLTSFAIAGILFLIHENTSFSEMGFFSYWLARVNLVLGVFNLLPAFPLDGGRAFRSLLAAKSGMVKATLTTVKLAKGFSWALGILGFLSFNFLLMLIAIFVYATANSEMVVTISRGMLIDIIVSDVYIKIPPVSEGETLRGVAEKMIRTRHRIFPVQTQEGLPAVLTADLLKKIPREQWAMTSAREVSQRVSRFLSLGDRIDEAFQELASAGALPVRDNGVIVGIVSYADITELVELKSLAESKQSRKAA